MYEIHPLLSVIIAIGAAIFFILFGAKLFETFWSRLVSDIFQKRKLNYQEALSIILLFSIATA